MTAAGRESPLQGWFTPRGRGDRESGENYAPAVISTNKRGAETRGTRAPTSLAMFTREGANYFSKCHSLPPPRHYLIPSLFFFFFFFFSSPLPVPFSVPDHRTTRTRYRGSFALRRVESEGREWDESLLLLVFGSWFIFFFSPPFFLFFDLSFFMARGLPRKIEFLQREDERRCS